MNQQSGNKVQGNETIILTEARPTLANKRQREIQKQACDLNSRYTKDMTNKMEARMYAHTHIVLARVQYNENRPAHLVLYSREKQLKVRRMQGISPAK